MSCAAYSDVIRDAASGDGWAALPPAVQAHIGTCAACRAEWERRSALAAAIDAGVAAMVAGEPSPGFAAGIRRRMEEPSNTAPFLGRWPVVAAALAAALLVVWVSRPGEPVPSGRETAITNSASRSPQAAAAETPATTGQPAVVVQASSTSRGRSGSAKRKEGAAPAAPVVLVNPAERAALDGLLLAIRQGRVRAADAFPATPGPNPPAEMVTPELTIAPLEISALSESGADAAPHGRG